MMKLLHRFLSCGRNNLVDVTNDNHVAMRGFLVLSHRRAEEGMSDDDDDK